MLAKFGFQMVGLEPNDYEPSEYRTCSVFEPPLYLGICIFKKSSDAKWAGFGMPFEHRTAQPFEYWTN